MTALLIATLGWVVVGGGLLGRAESRDSDVGDCTAEGINLYNRALMSIAASKWASALDDLNRTVPCLPDSSDALIARAEVQRNLGNLDLGIRDATAAIAKHPGNPRGYYERGLLHFDTGRHEAAVEDFKAARRHGYGLRAITATAILYLKIQKFERALELLDEALESGEQPDAQFRGVRASALYYAGAFERAIEEYTKAIAIDGQDLRAFANRGHVYEKIGDAASAVADYKRVLALDDRKTWATERIERLTK